MVGARRREDEVLALGDGAGVHPKYDGKQRQELPLGHLTCGRTPAEVCRALKGMEPGAGGFSPTEFGWHEMGKAYTGRKGARRGVGVVWSFHPWFRSARPLPRLQRGWPMGFLQRGASAQEPPSTRDIGSECERVHRTGKYVSHVYGSFPFVSRFLPTKSFHIDCWEGRNFSPCLKKSTWAVPLSSTVCFLFWSAWSAPLSQRETVLFWWCRRHVLFLEVAGTR